ncbi:hypothetical protein NC652_008244 [Populus alba x Populus x berolinensis]|nr:hypothetical protein NC652_008244 [Populus alba x Populus x berolinensis]
MEGLSVLVFTVAVAVVQKPDSVLRFSLLDYQIKLPLLILTCPCAAEKRVIPGSGPDDFKSASFMSVTLSCDHRVIDGAIGAEWLKAFKGYIENPESMLL